MNNPFLSLILPAHNEEQRILSCLENVKDFLGKQEYSCEILIVENASTDNTFEMAKGFARRNKKFHVMHLDDPGKGLAVKTGMLAARGSYRFFADVDFSMPVAEINRFFPPAVPDAQVTIASREAPGAVRYNEPAIRHLTGRVFNSLVKLSVVPGLQDTQCGFKCFRDDIAEEIFSRQTMTGWSFDAEILFIARKRDYQIVEISIPWYFNPNSKVRLVKDSFRMASDILAIRHNDRLGKYA